MTIFVFYLNFSTPGTSVFKVNLIVQCLEQWTVKERLKQQHEYMAKEML